MASSGAGASFCVSKARNSWTPPARLCPELCGKLQLAAGFSHGSAGKHRALALKGSALPVLAMPSAAPVSFERELQ